MHFPAEQLDKHDSEIVIRPETESRLAVHLGFLQILHHYEIRFSVKDKLAEDLEANPLQNLHCKIVDVRPSEDGEYSRGTGLLWVSLLDCLIPQEIVKRYTKVGHPV